MTKRTKERKIEKMDRLKLFTLKHELLQVSVYLQTAFAAETHLAEEQWLKEQLNVVKLRMSRVGTQMPTVSRTEGQHLVPI
jgi:RNA-binding protein YlmH